MSPCVRQSGQVTERNHSSSWWPRTLTFSGSYVASHTEQRTVRIRWRTRLSG